MLVAVIDDGISKIHCKGIQVAEDWCIWEDGSITPCEEDNCPVSDHGTTCAGIIQKFAPKAEFISLRIFHDMELKATCGQLLTALNWCYEKKIPLIHMSTGTDQLIDFEKIRPLTAKILRQGQVIVAAANNKGRHTAPAWFYGVIGVKGGEDMEEGEIREVSSGEWGVPLLANSRHTLAWNPLTQQCNSYAAPLVTAGIYPILAGREPLSLTVAEVYHRLTGKQGHMWQMEPDYLDEAVILNLGKKKIWQKDLFFSCRFIVDDVEALDKLKLQEKDNLLVIPSEDYQREEEFIKRQQRQLLSLTYLGTAPSGMKKIMAPLLYWEEGEYKKMFRQSPESREKRNFPVVHVKRYDETTPVFISRLCKILNEEEYPTVPGSEYIDALLYGLTYIPKEVGTSHWISAVNDTREVSGVVTEEESFGPGNPDDAYIEFTDTDCFRIEGDNIQIPQRDSLKYVKDVFEFMDQDKEES